MTHASAAVSHLPEAVVVPLPEQERLLAIVRAVIAVAAGAAPPEALDAELARGELPARQSAAFVTLTAHRDLRGCMGVLDSATPAWVAVSEAARWAAVEDPRFRPIGPGDLASLHVEISILGPLVRLADLRAFRLGTDGIVVRRGGRRGLLLPEVAGMPGMDRTTMLDTCCRKAGLPSGAWRDASSELWAFRTCQFGGPLVAPS